MQRKFSLKSTIMSAATMRTDIKTWAEELDDDFISVVHAMMGTYAKQREENPVVGYEADGTEVRAKTLANQVLRERERAKQGEYITAQELDRKTSSWLEATK